MGKGKESDPTDASVNTSADTSANTLPTHSSKNLPFLTLILLRLSDGSKNNVIRKEENMKAKQPPL